MSAIAVLDSDHAVRAFFGIKIAKINQLGDERARSQSYPAAGASGAQTHKNLGDDYADNRERPAGFSYRILGGVYIRKDSSAHKLIDRHFGWGAHRETNLLLGASKEKLTLHSEQKLLLSQYPHCAQNAPKQRGF